MNAPFAEDFVHSARWAAKSRGRVQRHPDYLLIAAAVLEQEGHTVKFCDGSTKSQKLKKILMDWRPNFVVINTNTPTIYNDVEWAHISKDLCKCRTVLVGPHVSAEPESTRKMHPWAIDFIITGEYEEALKHIVNKHYKKPQTYRGQSIDINDLPVPAWHLIDLKDYWDGGKLHPFVTILGSRGCIGKCTFCRDTQVMNRCLRMRDPVKIVAEMDIVKETYPFIKEFMFEDDTFTSLTYHAQQVCELLLKRKYKWSCNVRVDMDLTLLPLMKKAGCRMLMVGYEFGTQDSLNSVGKGTTIEQAQAFTKAAKKLGFIIHGCFMIGAPGEDRISAMQTIHFAKALKIDTAQFSGIAVYPGTHLYNWAKANDYLVAKDWTEWVNEDKEQATVLSYPQLTKDEIDELVDYALKSFYLRFRQMWRMVWSIRSWADLKRKLFGLTQFMRYFKK